jgi:hypothetical protein
MTYNEWKGSRSDLYFSSVEAIRRGESPLPGTRPLHISIECWQDVVNAIVFLVNNRQDSKRPSTYHTPVKMNRKQWLGRREWYLANIRDLVI